VIVGGHTHQGVAHLVNGIAIIESFSYGTAFGRVDLTIDPAASRVTDVRIFAPQDVCRDRFAHAADCATFEYEGAPVTPSAAVTRAIEGDLERASELRAEPVGVTLASEFPTTRTSETALGNLLADLIRAAKNGDVGLMNGGGIRAPLPAGALAYGSFYETFPFDNRFAVATLTGAELREYLASSVASEAGRLSLSGVVATARCEDGAVTVALVRSGRRPRPVRDDERLRVVMSDFLATVEGPVLDRARSEGRVEIDEGEPMREALVDLLRARGGTLDPNDRSLLDPAEPRLRAADYPLRCR
jgi:2',3'-cyclic-nucleotide 2'-phosphodiesterase (5'-nucleotidase family)